MSAHHSISDHQGANDTEARSREGHSLFTLLQGASGKRTFWAALAAFATITILYSVLDLPQVVLRAAGYKGPLQWYAIDNAVGAPASTIYTYLHAYGAAGRTAVIMNHLTFDVLFPFAYMILLAISLTIIGRSLFRPNGHWRWLTLMPLAAAACDFVENAGIVGMCLTYATHPTTLAVARVTSVFTVLKFTFLMMSVTLVLLGGLSVAMHRGISRTQSGRAQATTA